MKKVFQQLISKSYGDCTRACLASILELPIDAVPNFIRFGKNWFSVFYSFLKVLGCEYFGTGFPISEDRPKGDKLEDTPNINGYVIGSVPSKNFKEMGHSVVINLKGKVVHDPSPKKQWQNVNVLKTKDLRHWMMIAKMEIE